MEAISHKEAARSKFKAGQRWNRGRGRGGGRGTGSRVSGKAEAAGSASPAAAARGDDRGDGPSWDEESEGEDGSSSPQASPLATGADLRDLLALRPADWADRARLTRARLLAEVAGVAPEPDEERLGLVLDAGAMESALAALGDEETYRILFEESENELGTYSDEDLSDGWDLSSEDGASDALGEAAGDRSKGREAEGRGEGRERREGDEGPRLAWTTGAPRRAEGGPVDPTPDGTRGALPRDSELADRLARLELPASAPPNAASEDGLDELDELLALSGPSLPGPSAGAPAATPSAGRRGSVAVLTPGPPRADPAVSLPPTTPPGLAAPTSTSTHAPAAIAPTPSRAAASFAEPPAPDGAGQSLDDWLADL